MPRKNKYKKAWNILKSKKIDERLKYLDEGPTNSTSGAYVQTPGNYSSSPLPVARDGETVERNPAGEDLTGTDISDLIKTSGTDLNLTADDPDQNGQDTSGLFDDNGIILTEEPPGDTTAILGPMISMWYAWANYTQIGYVRESDRKMVNLGRINGELDDWDGESGFTTYGQLTIEQAKWYRDQSREDYRAFYPGPPSNPADNFGRYLGSIVNTPKFQTFFSYLNKSWNPSVNDFLDASSIFSLLLGTDDSILTDIFSNSALGKQGLVFLGYLTNQLGDIIDNEFLGQDYVNSSFEDMKLGYDNNGKPISSVGDNIIGSGQYPKYNPETNEIEVEFNYDFKKNIDEFKGKEGLHDGMFGEFQKLVYNALGPYSVDASVGPSFVGPITGSIFSSLINAAKGIGGGKATPGKMTISPQELQKLNPKAYDQLMRNGTVPADASSKPSQNKEVSKDGIKPDPKKIVDTIKQNAPPELKMAMDPSMDNFNKLSPKAQSEIMDNMKKNFMKNYDGSNFKGKELQGYKNKIQQQRKIAAKNVKFEKGYMITTNQTASGPMTQKVPLFQQKNNESRGRLLTESRRESILKNVKKPVPQLPENKIKYKISGRDSKGNKTVGKDLIQDTNLQKQFVPAKKPPSVWGKGQIERNIRSSQEKKNEVLELIGEGDFYWEKLIEKNQRGFDKSKKRIEEENERISEMIANEMQSQYETYMIKEGKIDKLKDIVKKYDYPDKPSRAGYPNDPPPETINGYHPDLVNIDQKAKQYNSLDPQSARAMPKTASKAIDAKVREIARRAKIKGERRPNNPK